MDGLGLLMIRVYVYHTSVNRCTMNVGVKMSLHAQNGADSSGGGSTGVKTIGFWPTLRLLRI